VKNGQAGKIFEGGRDEIIVLTNPAYGWVWIKTWNDGVAICFRHFAPVPC
jgi:hypothetical protein